MKEPKTLIATRLFSKLDSKEQVRALLYKPTPAPKRHGFLCYFRVVGLTTRPSRFENAWGIDSLQSLQQAIQGIRSVVEPHKNSLRFNGGTWLGLSRPLPSGFSPEIDYRFEQVMEQEHRQLRRELLVAGRRRPRRGDVEEPRRASPSVAMFEDVAPPAGVTRAGELLVARRALDWSDKRGQVNIDVFMPERNRDTDVFHCRFSLSGLPSRTQGPHEGWGIDSLQALDMAIQGVRAVIEPLQSQLRWNGSYWLGLPRLITDGFGPEIDRRFELLIDRELERLAQELTRQGNHGVKER